MSMYRSFRSSRTSISAPATITRIGSIGTTRQNPTQTLGMRTTEPVASLAPRPGAHAPEQEAAAFQVIPPKALAPQAGHVAFREITPKAPATRQAPAASRATTPKAHAITRVLA